MFSRSPAPTTVIDDAHLEVTVTPSASAFYAGEMFSAVIKLRNTRIAPSRTSGVYSQPASPNPTYLDFVPGTGANGTVGGTPSSPDRAWSAAGAGWRGDGPRRPSLGHSRRSRSLALDKETLSPQEILGALNGSESECEIHGRGSDLTPAASPIAGPPLPPRRTHTIPPTHPHARKISIASSAAFADSPPQPNVSLPTDYGSDRATPPVSPHPAQGDFLTSTPEAGPSRTTSSHATRTTSPALPDVMEEDSPPGTRHGSKSISSPPLSSASPGSSAVSTPRRSPLLPPSRRHGRSPSLDTSNPALLSPPVHPSMRSRSSLHIGTTTILWAHARLVARFEPSQQYIPPDPLLPLRARLLHQPIGSGSLSSSEERNSSSRWSLSFGTGSIGQGTQPSLTGSLFGLAKGLVTGGTGGSLEEERKRVWSTQDLPVLDTSRSLLGVDLMLGEGETREFVYTIQLPTALPPAFKGRALRFSYEMVLSLNVALPGGGMRQRNKDITIPIRVWPNVSIGHPVKTYDVLQPIIQTTEQGSVIERPLTPPSSPTSRAHLKIELPQKPDSLAQYARRLVDSLDDPSGTKRVPPSPSTAMRSLSPPRPAQSPGHLRAPEVELPPRMRPRATSIVAGDDELVAEAQRCGEAVEILSRHSPKSSYDIRQDGEVVAVLTLVKTTYRLGETVLGVVMFNDATDHRVLRLTAYLESHEVIPEPLLPPSASTSGRVRQPELRRNHAESRTSYAQFTERTAFSLDIPSDATPGFSLSAGEGAPGGLEWRVRIAFLVASASKRKSIDRRSRDGLSAGQGRKSSEAKRKPTACLHLTPTEGDSDNTIYSAAAGLAPLVAISGGWAEAKATTVEAEVPVQVLAGNTAFVVRPSVFTV